MLASRNIVTTPMFTLSWPTFAVYFLNMKCWRFDGLEYWIWSEELVDEQQTVPYQPGALIWGDQLSGSVSNPLAFLIPVSRRLNQADEVLGYTGIWNSAFVDWALHQVQSSSAKGARRGLKYPVDISISVAQAYWSFKHLFRTITKAFLRGSRKWIAKHLKQRVNINQKLEN